MFTHRRFPLWRAIIGSWRLALVLGVYASLLCVAHTVLGWEWLSIPALPVSLLGTAVSFYLGFKGNAAYGRLWEARKIWGGIVNTSRTWGIHVLGMVGDDEATQTHVSLCEVHRRLIYRHVAWLGALRTQLRRTKAWEHIRDSNNQARKTRDTLDMSPDRLEKRIKPFVSDEERQWLMARKNQSTQLLQLQSQDLRRLRQENRIDDFRHMELARVLETLFTLQGKCERIKNFPLPRQYATANHWFVILFVSIVPMAMVGAFDDPSGAQIWWSVPASMLIGWVFITWDVVVDFSENPFQGLFTDIPIDALSRTIEIDLRDMLGEEDLPEAIGTDKMGVLM